MRIKTACFLMIVLFFSVIGCKQTENVEIRFGWWGGDTRHKPTLEAIRLFEKKNPNVTIKSEYMGWGGYAERLTTEISGGQEPDVMQINWAWISTMYSKDGNGFYDLNKAKDELSLKEFGPLLKTGLFKGKLNAIPVSFTARTYIYQKNTFDKAGIAIPKTWDDLFAAGQIFKKKLGDTYYPIDGNIYDVILMAHAYELQKSGKQWIDPEKGQVAWSRTEAKDFISFYKKLSDLHCIVPLKLRLSTSGPEAPTEQQQDWVKGRWAGNYTWDSTFKTRKSSLPVNTEVVVGDFLTMPGAKNSGFFGRPSLMFAVSKNSKNPLIAARLINFLLTDPEAVEILGVSWGIPLAKSAYEQLMKKNIIGKDELAAKDQVDKAVIEAPSAYFEHARIQELIRSICEKISYGKITDEQAVTLLIDETNKELMDLQ